MGTIKKFAVMVAFCVAFVLGNFQTGFAYPKPVAVITNYEEVAGGIAIQRANGIPGGSDALLYPGDAITGNVGYVKIKCAPYADFHAQNGAYVISYNPPTGIRGVAQSAIDYVNSFWNNVESVVSGASRGSDDEPNLNPRPGFDVTLLTNQTVRFAWDGAAKNFVIKDGKGKKVFDKKIGAANSIELVPNVAKLKAGQKYSWSLDDTGDFKFTILDAQTEKDILDRLAELDAENISAEERTLKKAAYVQLISDLYPDTVDLYWLSAQWLSEISPTDGKLSEDKSVLLKKCARHLDEEM